MITKICKKCEVENRITKNIFTATITPSEIDYVPTYRKVKKVNGLWAIKKS